MLRNYNKKLKNINTSQKLLNFIQPIKSINIFRNFVLNFKGPCLEELHREQIWDKIRCSRLRII